MFAAASQEKSNDGFSQDCGEDVTRTAYEGKKKTRSPQATLPPLCPEPSCVLAASAAKPLFSLSSILKTVSSDGPSSGADQPHPIAKVGPGIAVGNTKCTEGPRLKASRLGTAIPVRSAQAQRYIIILTDIYVECSCNL